jgi:predicted O-methyltransferase YrrM
MIHRRLIAKGIKYYLTLPHKNGRGIHSTFLLRLVNKVSTRKIESINLCKIENYRQKLLADSSKINILDLGAGNCQPNHIRKVKEIAVREGISHRYGKLLYNLVLEFKPMTMIEVGTSLGIGSLYMLLGNPEGKLITMEGSPEKASLASSMLHKESQNVEVVKGNFDDTLPEVLDRNLKIDFAFIDGNHKKESTLRYFEQILKNCHNGSVIVLDDISWSTGMTDAWDEIKKHKQASICLDLFRLGIVFVDSEHQKENFTIFY